jgi:hypothetical protein
MSSPRLRRPIHRDNIAFTASVAMSRFHLQKFFSDATLPSFSTTPFRRSIPRGDEQVAECECGGWTPEMKTPGGRSGLRAQFDITISPVPDARQIVNRAFARRGACLCKRTSPTRRSRPIYRSDVAFTLLFAMSRFCLRKIFSRGAACASNARARAPPPSRLRRRVRTRRCRGR